MQLRLLLLLAVVSLMAYSFFPHASGDPRPEANKDLVITEFSVDPESNDATFSFEAKPGHIYAIDRSTTLLPASLSSAGWLEINDSLVAQSEIQSFTDHSTAFRI